MMIMKFFLPFLLVLAVVMAEGGDAMAIEEAKYTVVVREGKFEVRDYAAHILAETVVKGDLEGAGSVAFNKLFQYISGNNQTNAKVNMTSPVSQAPDGEKIDMTAPVSQKAFQDKWVVSFMMPASYTMESLPRPLNSKVTLREVPERRMATVRYSGFWSEEGYLQNISELKLWIERAGLSIIGEPLWARYNSPFSLWFLRRNEILIPVAVE